MTMPRSIPPTLVVTAEQDSLDGNGRVRAGWLLNQIDQAAILAGEVLAAGPVTAVSANAFQLQVPIYLGDKLSLYAECLRSGQRSLVLKISAQAERSGGAIDQITEVILTYVAVDHLGRSRDIH